jgi:hypothetical protein
MASLGSSVEHSGCRFAGESDCSVFRSNLDLESRHRLCRLLQFCCTKMEWAVLRFQDGTLGDGLALATPSEGNLPLEIIPLRSISGRPIESPDLFQLAIEKAKGLGVRELYCTIPENSAEAAVLSHSQFRSWRKIVRFESDAPGNPCLSGYRSIPVASYHRPEIIALIEKAAEYSADSQIEFYRRQLGGIADAEMTLAMMESIKFDPSWWRTALAPDGQPIGIILPVMAFGEPTIGFVGVHPEHRGRNIASFLIWEAWSVMKLQGYSTLCAEADIRSTSMHRVLLKSQFNRRWQRQEWKLEF